MKHSVVDARTGRVPDANLAEYPVPVHADRSAMDVIFVDENDPHVNPLGVKGGWGDRHGRRRARNHQRDFPRHRQAHSGTAGYSG